ncbi:cystathionine gamma-synthase [Plenodomus tracheiphilus IPT5]|uniref:Cystathionine gamma-synthase n=1 Tax=Plenodomus tracheiphilus IPT5 TaxID=1408161 RepID=A0A6A7AML9_9PLEO|nr:cystathionine gamma-synthase [Plenodomus tracheiphilus IPT5]
MALQNPKESPRRVLTAESLQNALSDMAPATRAIHADDFYSPHQAIAPAMHVAVNYRYARDPDNLVPMENLDPNAPHDSHTYARETAPNSNRFETLLRHLFGGHVVSYSTGLAAFHASMVLLNPKRIFVTEGYHGVHGVIDVMTKLTGLRKLTLEDLDQLQAGDVVHVETPLNPTGEARNLTFYAAKARAARAYLTVDSTFGPPPLQDPLQYGADIVIHSGTKYVGGHSDMLCGILVVHPERVQAGWVETLYSERMVLGSVMGSLEGWLGLRSIRTMQLRVKRQSDTCTRLVTWLQQEMQTEGSVIGRTVHRLQHASLQQDALNDGWLQKQMSGGFGSVFCIWMKDGEHAKRLPSRLRVFQHATSLGGVESLMEWRAMSDRGCDQRLLRVSCGIEDVEDMQDDLEQALGSLLKDFPLV